MIRAAVAGDAALVQQRARAAPGVGPRLEVEWALLCQNPKMPYRFYIVDEEAVLAAGSRDAVLCGPVANEEELLSFLGFAGITRLVTDGTLLFGWMPDLMQVMEWTDGARQSEAPAALPQGFIDKPPMEEVMDVLAASIPEHGGAWRDGFYADVCARQNHGLAHMVGLRRAGALVAVAGALCLTPAEAYLGGVETLPAWQGQGFASALVRHLCGLYAQRRVTLLCQGQLVPFYTRLDFMPGRGVALGSRAPGERG